MMNSNGKIRALLVEDNMVAQKVGVKLLTAAGCLADAASNGIEALNLLAENAYDIIFMDIGLPDTDGLSLTETIRKTEGKNKTVPIIILTAHSDNEYRNRAIWSGTNEFMVKPLTPQNCEQALRTFIPGYGKELRKVV
jgi:two-component system, OmpR family, aerobic respiration control sensor histidine kinase ArcB